MSSAANYGGRFYGVATSVENIMVHADRFTVVAGCLVFYGAYRPIDRDGNEGPKREELPTLAFGAGEWQRVWAASCLTGLAVAVDSYVSGPNTGQTEPAPLAPHVGSDILNEKEAAEFLKSSCRALQRWRLTGEGPAYRRMGKRRVVYAKADLQEYLDGQRHTSTSAEGYRRKND